MERTGERGILAVSLGGFSAFLPAEDKDELSRLLFEINA
jgi:hypothetical protein